MNEELLEFAHWVAKEVCCSDEEWENKSWAFQELVCRKLAKLGVIKEEGGIFVYEYEDDEEDIFP